MSNVKEPRQRDRWERQWGDKWYPLQPTSTSTCLCTKYEQSSHEFNILISLNKMQFSLSRESRSDNWFSWKAFLLLVRRVNVRFVFANLCQFDTTPEWQLYSRSVWWLGSFHKSSCRCTIITEHSFRFHFLQISQSNSEINDNYSVKS